MVDRHSTPGNSVLSSQCHALLESPEWLIVRGPRASSRLRLYTPYYEGAIYLTWYQYFRWNQIREAALEQKIVWLPDNLQKHWEGNKKNKAFSTLLLEKSKGKEVQNRKTFLNVTAKQVQDLLMLETEPEGRRLKEGEKPSARRLPLRDEKPGRPRIYFTFTWLFEKLNARTSESERVTRMELVGVLQAMGAEDRPIGSRTTHRRIKFL